MTSIYTFNLIENIIYLYIIIYISSILNFLYLYTIISNISINQLHVLSSFASYKVLYFSIIIMFLNFSGVPPLSMFLVKLQILKILFFKLNVLLIFFFCLVNIFGFLFYTSMLRYVQVKKQYKVVIKYVSPVYSFIYLYITIFMMFHIFWIINFCLIISY